MIRIALFLISAVIAGVALAFAFALDLPKPKPIDPNSMVKVDVVAVKEPTPEPGSVMDVGEMTTGYVHRDQYAYTPTEADPEPFYDEPVSEPEPVARRAPAPVQSDPLHYRRYVQENVRQDPPKVYYGGQRNPPRIQQVDPDPYRNRPRTYYSAPPSRDDRQRGCNAMATWCNKSRAPNENRDRMQENRGEDFFE